MDDKEKLEKIVQLIEQSDLDRTIKDILIRDIQNEGLTDFLREQIRVFCLEGIKKLDALEEAKAVLEPEAQNQNTTEQSEAASTESTNPENPTE